MKKITIRTRKIALVLWLITLLAGCNLPNNTEETDQSGFVYTSAAETVNSQLTTVASQKTQLPPTLPPPGQDASPTSDSASSAPPAATITSAPPASNSPPPAPNSPPPCNAASFVSDVTYPDNSQVLAGSTFVKTWRLTNVGTCSWTSSYELMFNSGVALGAPATQPLVNTEIKSGTTVDISVNLTAPADPGTYRADFMIRSPDGKKFGIGPNATGTFYVQIVVVKPSSTSTPTVTLTPTVTVTSTIDLKPDLSISSVQVTPPTPVQGQPIQVNVTITNNGNATAENFSVDWFASDADALAACSWTVTTLQAGGSFGLACSYPGYAAPAPNVNSKAVVDTANSVAESNENNNTAILSYAVAP